LAGNFVLYGKYSIHMVLHHNNWLVVQEAIGILLNNP